jgi:MFS family permease
MTYKKNIILLITIQALVLANFAASTLVIFLKDNGISISQILFLQAFASAIVVLFEIPTGVFADVKGRKSSIIIAAALYAAASFIMLFASSFITFLISLGTAAMALVFFSGALDAIIYDSIKNTPEVKNISKLFAYANLCKAVAIGVAVILGGIVAKINFRYNFLIMTFLGIAAFVVSLTVKEPPYQKKKTTIVKEGGNLKKTIKYVLNHDPLLLLMGMSAVLGNLLAIIIVYLQPLMFDVGFDIALFGFVFAFLTIIQAIGGRVGSYLEKHVTRRDFAFVGVYGVAFSYAVLAISFKPVMFTLSMCLLSFFAGMFVPVWIAYSNRFIPSQKRATITSLGSLVNSSIFLFFSPIFGLFTEAFSMRFSILLASVFSLMVVPILARRLEDKVPNK